jgi:hypothetical protein
MCSFISNISFKEQYLFKDFNDCWFQEEKSMSMSIVAIHTIKGQLSCTYGDFCKVLRLDKKKQFLPEVSSFDDSIVEHYEDEGFSLDEELIFEEIIWFGTGSYFDIFIKHVLPIMKGSMDIAIQYDDGSNLEGYRLENGAATKMTVTLQLS